LKNRIVELIVEWIDSVSFY